MLLEKGVTLRVEDIGLLHGGRGAEIPADSTTT